MEELESVKNNIVNLLERIELCIFRNIDFFENEISLNRSKIIDLYRNKLNETVLQSSLKSFSNFKKNKDLLITFGKEIKETISDINVSSQYVYLLNSEIQNLNFYFNTDYAYHYLKENLTKLNELSVDYQLVNSIFSYLQQFFNDTSNFNQSYTQKIAQLKAFGLVKDTGNNENVVIIGANGSGKSSFSRNIQHILGKSIVIIQAQKVFQYRKENQIYINDSKLNEVYSFQQSEKSCKDTSFVDTLRNDMNTLIEALISDYIQYTTEYYQSRGISGVNDIDEPVLEKVFHLWHEIIPHREIFYDKKNGLQVKGQNCQNYDFIYLSDGEKAVFYYAAHILLAKKNSYIIIDEPENHLNFAVVNKMWNILEQKRKDCVFMYLTHNINFASSRVNSRKLWMKSYNQENFTWNIIPLPSDSALPESLYMELLGSRSKILFCEGDDNSSLDSKLYSILFPEYTIKPVKGHYNVIQSVRAFNKSSSIHGNSAIGIIDRDCHGEEEIKTWTKDKIYSLPVCEIENIFLDEKLIEISIGQFFVQESLECIKAKIFGEFRKDIEKQSILYARDRVNFILTGSMITKKDNIEVIESEIKGLSQKINCKDLYESKKAELNDIVNKNDYEKLTKNSNSKGLCSKLNSYIVPNYKERVILMLRDNEDLVNYIKLKYFNKID